MPRRRIVEDSSDEEANDSSNSIPSDDRLEKALRNSVANIFRTGKLEELTVKRVRRATETALGLEEGFFKAHEKWKTRSDQIIKDEAEKHEEPEEDEITDKSPAPPTKPPKSKTKKPVKRIPEENSASKKKRRKVSSEVESPEATPPPVDEDEGDVEEEAKSASPNPPSEEAIPDKGEQSESEMSVLLDEEPPKPRPKKAASVPKARAPKSTSKPTTDADPDQAEIKRLQGWLIKCGIRKMWARELAPYDTPKAKIKHLKMMLENAGMKGRYSADKARQIREARELQADLEAVKEGASRWGTGSAQDESGSEEKPRRRLVKGRQSLAFLSDDGEETD
ncbi:transcriptional regulator [Talaromyces pinophilus]|uniref:Transcriptional regulator n=1 Tax=Talaromyces pinophilus TaxID=128442 RepID=A0A6V8HHW3_TALPI|nr:transcriptional regulator [Talaromyces pinophilus]